MPGSFEFGGGGDVRGVGVRLGVGVSVPVRVRVGVGVRVGAGVVVVLPQVFKPRESSGLDLSRIFFFFLNEQRMKKYKTKRRFFPLKTFQETCMMANCDDLRQRRN